MAVIKIINMLNNLFLYRVGSSTCTCVLKYRIYVHNKYSKYCNGTDTFSLTEWKYLYLSIKVRYLDLAVTLYYHDLLKYYIQF